MDEPSQAAREGEYVVVARRYRPQRFEELIGQEHVARALSNAITTNRVGHAYLFTGARGVGKTSAARIFAKALDLAAWWSELMKIPAIVMGGGALESVGTASASGIEFVALRHAVWEHGAGASAAVAEANRLLALAPGPAT